jgi:hypothetical protein
VPVVRRSTPCRVVAAARRSATSTLATCLALALALSLGAAVTAGRPAGASPDDDALPEQVLADQHPRAGAARAARATVGGDVHAFGAARPLGSRDGTNLRHPVETIAATPSGRGYWLATAAGEVFAYGDARHHGDLRGVALNLPIVGMASTPAGRGYWLVASDGGVFSFGDARFFGSTGTLRLNQPIVGMAPTPAGRGYWLVASDGGIFSFGDARFFGSTGARLLNEPVVGMAPTPTGRGYWLVASDGGVFSFGDARFFGSTGGLRLNEPISGLAPTPRGDGYWLVAVDGGVFSFGDARFFGSAPGAGVGGVIAGMAVRPQGDGYWLAAADVGDTIDVWQPGGFGPGVRDALLRAAASSGSAIAIFHSGTVGLLAVHRRTGAVVQAATPGWRIPMASAALDPRAALGLSGPTISAALLRGEVVMGARSARLRGAQVGDTVTFVGWNGTIVSRRIGAIAPTRRAGSTELLFSSADAASFGFVWESSATFYGFSSGDGVLAAIGRELPPAPYFAVSPSWNPRPGDAIAPTVGLKERLGEFQYVPAGGGAITIDPAWVARNIGPVALPILGTLTCNRTAGVAMAAALAEIQAAGLAGLVDVADSRANGGCYVPREIRGPSGGAISRHAWGVAVDINPSTNPFGAAPRLDGRIVDIFRRHGFAWGGSWARPDGMHFEWTG